MGNSDYVMFATFGDVQCCRMPIKLFYECVFVQLREIIFISGLENQSDPKSNSPNLVIRRFRLSRYSNALFNIL